jgi:hypothetical protein
MHGNFLKSVIEFDSVCNIKSMKTRENRERFFQNILNHRATKLRPWVTPSLNNHLVNEDDLVKTEEDIIRMVSTNGFISTVMDAPFRERLNPIVANMVLNVSKSSQIKTTLVLLACIPKMVA